MRRFVLILVAILLLQEVVLLPIMEDHRLNSQEYAVYRYPQTVLVPNTRGFWDFVGNWIQGIQWLPIQINVPDTFGGITTGISTFANGIIQRIPFINRRNSTQASNRPFLIFPPAVDKTKTDKMAYMLMEEDLPYP